MTQTSTAAPARTLLAFGVVAGPIYVLVSLVQALIRDGFDLTRHAWSLLSNGDLGWIQITNLVVTGLMTVAVASGAGSAWSNLAFTATIVLAWAWVSALAAHLTNG